MAMTNLTCSCMSWGFSTCQYKRALSPKQLRFLHILELIRFRDFPGLINKRRPISLFSPSQVPAAGSLQASSGAVPIYHRVRRPTRCMVTSLPGHEHHV